MNDLSQVPPMDDADARPAVEAAVAAAGAPAAAQDEVVTSRAGMQTAAQTATAPSHDAALDAAVTRATDAILAAQRDDGHWVYELEADATIPAEYILLVHYLGEEPNLELEQKIGRYLRRIQLPNGGWPLFTDGALDVSASVKAYFALKMIGDSVD